MNLIKALRNNRVSRPHMDKGTGKRILLSYVPKPLHSKLNLHHNSNYDVLLIKECFTSLGFLVDVYHYLDKSCIDYSTYSGIIGFGYPLINYFHKNNPKKIPVVYYGTGSHESFQNTVTLRRAQEVYKKTHSWMLDSTRIVDQTWSEQTTLVDYMIILGNDAIANTYLPFPKNKMMLLNAVAHPKINSANNLKFNHDLPSDFVWMSGPGAIHRGLDLVLETFTDLPHLNLHICSNLKKEKSFYSEFKHYLNKPNIHYHGFVTVGSQKYNQIVSLSPFSILPTASEGQSTSLVNLMKSGLIPITNLESGLPPNEIGIKITNLTKKSIMSAVTRASKLTPRKLTDMKNMTLTNAYKHHSKQAVKKVLTKYLAKIYEV